MGIKAQSMERLTYLRSMLVQARLAVLRSDGSDLEDICNEIDGTSAQLREYAEYLIESKKEQS